MPTTTLATSGCTPSASGSWSRSTCLACAPSTARLCSSGSGSPAARCRAQPRQQPAGPSGSGSPMPRVIESPRVTIRVMFLPARFFLPEKGMRRVGVEGLVDSEEGGDRGRPAEFLRTCSRGLAPRGLVPGEDCAHAAGEVIAADGYPGVADHL